MRGTVPGLRALRWLLVASVALAVLLEPHSANAGETRRMYGVTVTLPDSWYFENADPYYLQFRSRQYSRVYGSMNSSVNHYSSARAAAEDSRQYLIANKRYRPNDDAQGSLRQVGRVFDHVLGGSNGLKAALFNRWDAESGDIMRTVSYFAIRGGDLITVTFGVPDVLWKRPGIWDESDWIINHMRFF